MTNSISVAPTWRFGDVTITSVAEVETPLPIEFVLGAANSEMLQRHSWLQPHFATAEGLAILRIQLLVIESAGRTIAVDTCLGNDKPRTQPFFDQLQTPFLTTLEAAGFDRFAIDTVICTHMHVDHVGWNTMLVDGQWVPTFPNARYLFGRTEYEHWEAYGIHEDGDVFGDSVAPVFAAGLVDFVDAPCEVTSAVRLVPTPGHSPGHMSIEIDSAGATAFITGDVMHHPLQIAQPELGSNFDSDYTAAASMRAQVLARLADTDVTVIGTHFAGPHAGRVLTDGETYRFNVV